MGQGRPGAHIRSEHSEQLRSLDGDPRFLKKILDHPALKVLKRLDEEERRKAEVVARVEELGTTLSQANEQINGIFWKISQDGALEQKAKDWLLHFREAMRDIDRIRLGLSAAKYLQGSAEHRGLYAIHHERYFYAAFLVPYTAFLKEAKGKQASPDWKLIDAWLRKTHPGLREEKDLRLGTWWGKEVLQRKSRPSRPLLYALAAGAAVFLESKTGRRVKWIVERDHVGRPFSNEDHPALLKRTLTAQDRSYMRCVFKYVPLVRKDFIRLYPDTSGLATKLPRNPIEVLAEKRSEKTIAKLPVRLRIRLAHAWGEKLNTKALLKLAKAQLTAKNARRR